jgi:hypothetical protein
MKAKARKDLGQIITKRVTTSPVGSIVHRITDVTSYSNLCENTKHWPSDAIYTRPVHTRVPSDNASREVMCVSQIIDTHRVSSPHLQSGGVYIGVSHPIFFSPLRYHCHNLSYAEKPLPIATFSQEKFLVESAI